MTEGSRPDPGVHPEEEVAGEEHGANGAGDEARPAAGETDDETGEKSEFEIHDA